MRPMAAKYWRRLRRATPSGKSTMALFTFTRYSLVHQGSQGIYASADFQSDLPFQSGVFMRILQADALMSVRCLLTVHPPQGFTGVKGSIEHGILTAGANIPLQEAGLELKSGCGPASRPQVLHQDPRLYRHLCHWGQDSLLKAHGIAPLLGLSAGHDWVMHQVTKQIAALPPLQCLPCSCCLHSVPCAVEAVLRVTIKACSRHTASCGR